MNRLRRILEDLNDLKELTAKQRAVIEKMKEEGGYEFVSVYEPEARVVEFINLDPKARALKGKIMKTVLIRDDGTVKEIK